jgi:transcriptional regulator of aroF, aroG, tyrA and aromatic amino acid transport
MRIKILNIDRCGLVFDISRVLFEYQLNILYMQVEKNVIYLETKAISPESELLILEAIRQIASITDVLPMDDASAKNKTTNSTVIFDEILHASTSMQQAIAMAKRCAVTESTVLIRGETGTGKELFAKALHAGSPRAAKSFLALNCAALPENLLESELFGYEDGAFTGASRGGKAGLFELSNGGTLFLDEIGEISPHVQAKLLRVLQEHKIRRIGSKKEISLDVRIIAATNQDLEKMLHDGSFRADLYYRLNVVPLFLPPLRERREDISILVPAFLQQYAKRLNRDTLTISSEAMATLMQYDWPGNIRELENHIERAVNLVEGRSIQTEDIVMDSKKASPPMPTECAEGKKTLREILDETEKKILCQALCHYHTSRKLARALGISHTGVLQKLHKYGLDFASSQA